MNGLKAFHVMSNHDYQDWLDKKKSSLDCKTFFPKAESPYFYVSTNETRLLVLELEKLHTILETKISSYDSFIQNQIFQSCLIDEIQSTNSIEQINSTRHDIFYILNDISKRSQNTKIKSIILAYQALLYSEHTKIQSLEDVRLEYDNVISKTLKSSDKLDSPLFRKKPVYVSDGMKTIHTGFPPEEINQGMSEFLNVYNDESLSIYERLILSHFLLETIHPFYDGNGRFGRYLCSKALMESNSPSSSFLFATSIQKEKAKYYKAFKEARDPRNGGDLETFMIPMLNVLKNGIRLKINELEEKDAQVKKIIDQYASLATTNAKKNIIRILAYGNVYTHFGLNSKEIMDAAGVSKRTLAYFNQEFNNNLIHLDLGRYSYIKLK